MSKMHPLYVHMAHVVFMYVWHHLNSPLKVTHTKAQLIFPTLSKVHLLPWTYMPYGYVDKMFKPRESADAILATVLLQ